MKRRTLHAYLTEAKHKSLRVLRSPSFALPFLMIPVAFFQCGPAQRSNGGNRGFRGSHHIRHDRTGDFGFGAAVAIERAHGLLKLSRALPAPQAG